VANPTECPFAQECLYRAKDFTIYRMHRAPLSLKRLLLDAKSRRKVPLKEVAPRIQEGCNSVYLA